MAVLNLAQLKPNKIQIKIDEVQQFINFERYIYLLIKSDLSFSTSLLLTIRLEGCGFESVISEYSTQLSYDTLFFIVSLLGLTKSVKASLMVQLDWINQKYEGFRGQTEYWVKQYTSQSGLFMFILLIYVCFLQSILNCREILSIIVQILCPVIGQYFSLDPRLQRLFQLSKQRKMIRWPIQLSNIFFWSIILIIAHIVNSFDCKYRGQVFCNYMTFFCWVFHMTRKRIKGTKYNRVTKQQKYVFLKLCITQKQSIHEAAFNAGIHYSTAKTILFFHKKHYKNYSTYIVNQPLDIEGTAALRRAHWKLIPIDVDQECQNTHQVQIVVNSKASIANQNTVRKDSTNDGKNSDEIEVKIQQVECEFPFLIRQNQDFLKQLKCQHVEIKKQPKSEFNQDFFY